MDSSFRQKCPDEIMPLAEMHGGWDKLMKQGADVPEAFFAEWESWGYTRKHFFQMCTSYNLTEREVCLMQLEWSIHKAGNGPLSQIHKNLLDALLPQISQFNLTDLEIIQAVNNACRADQTVQR